MAVVLLEIAAEKWLKCEIRIERHLIDHSNPLENLLPNEVKEKFRFSAESITHICSIIHRNLQRKTKRSMALPTLLQVLIAIRFFATGSYFKVIADTLNVSKSTVCICVDAVSKELVKLSKK